MDSRTKAGKVQDEPEIVVEGRTEGRKENKEGLNEKWDFCKGHRCQPKGSPYCQLRNNLKIIINNGIKMEYRPLTR